MPLSIRSTRSGHILPCAIIFIRIYASSFIETRSSHTRGTATPNVIFGFESITSVMIDMKIERRNVITFQYILIGYLSFFLAARRTCNILSLFHGRTLWERFERCEEEIPFDKKRCYHVFSIVLMVKRIVFLHLKRNRFRCSFCAYFMDIKMPTVKWPSILRCNEIRALYVTER